MSPGHHEFFGRLGHEMVLVPQTTGPTDTDAPFVAACRGLLAALLAERPVPVLNRLRGQQARALGGRCRVEARAEAGSNEPRRRRGERDRAAGLGSRLRRRWRPYTPL